MSVCGRVGVGAWPRACMCVYMCVYTCITSKQSMTVILTRARTAVIVRTRSTALNVIASTDTPDTTAAQVSSCCLNVSRI